MRIILTITKPTINSVSGWLIIKFNNNVNPTIAMQWAPLKSIQTEISVCHAPRSRVQRLGDQRVWGGGGFMKFYTRFSSNGSTVIGSHHNHRIRANITLWHFRLVNEVIGRCLCVYVCVCYGKFVWKLCCCECVCDWKIRKCKRVRYIRRGNRAKFLAVARRKGQ